MTFISRFTALIGEMTADLASAAVRSPKKRSSRGWLTAKALMHDTTVSGTRGRIVFTFLTADGIEQQVSAKLGKSIVDVAVSNDVPELDAICEGSKQCSTCMVNLPQELYEQIGGDDAVDDEEEDMLDQAPHRTAYSRLGCQIHVTSAFEGCKISIPAEHINLQKDDDD